MVWHKAGISIDQCLWQSLHFHLWLFSVSSLKTSIHGNLWKTLHNILSYSALLELPLNCCQSKGSAVGGLVNYYSMYLLRKSSSIELPLWVLAFPAWKQVFKSSNRVQSFWKGERFLYRPELCAVLHTVEHTAKLIYLKDGDLFILFSSWPSISEQGNKYKGDFTAFFFCLFTQTCPVKYWADTRQQWHFDPKWDVQQLCVSSS